MAAFDSLSVRFGATGVHLWEVLVKQQLVVGMSAAVGTALLWATFAFCLQRYQNDNYDEAYGAAAIVLGVVGIFAAFFFFIEGIPRLINPEYYALMALLPGG
jgi:drug/metabolite transporter (DMT)-like permease